MIIIIIITIIITITILIVIVIVIVKVIVNTFYSTSYINLDSLRNWGELQSLIVKGNNFWFKLFGGSRYQDSLSAHFMYITFSFPVF